ncbi:MAG: M23 family metallopeptidase [Bacteroidales bacterium]|jgi:murein DD-endopeptidase MepM/ murein hydrolase activator NlpD|nr:M23 family metallopeptidase [Bacteroidales bacterium]
MSKDNKEKKRDLLRKYRIAVIDDESHRNLFAFHGTKWKILATLAVSLLLFAFCIAALVMYTPIRRVIPGYPSAQTRHLAAENARKVDSLEREMWIWSLQFSNLQRILSGEEPLKMDSLMQDRSALSEYAYSDLYQYEDSLLRDKIDRVERFNLSENRNRDLGLEALVLFPPVKGVVSSAYEEARHPYIDLAVEENSVVSSVLDGTVVFAGWQDETGYTMYIQHRDDLISVYKHNAKLLRQAGDKVTAGMPVAMSGNTGHLTTGPHLHFELWYRGMPIDPIKYMKL